MDGDASSIKRKFEQQVKSLKLKKKTLSCLKNRYLLIYLPIHQKNNEIQKLEKELDELSKKREELKPTAELTKLTAEHEKLKYRINILENVILNSILKS